MPDPILIPVEHDPWADLPKGPTELRQGPMGFSGWLPFVGEAAKQYLTEQVHGLANIVKYPVQQMRGEQGGFANPLQWAAQTGLTMMGGGTPFGKPAGALGAGPSIPFSEHPAVKALHEKVAASKAAKAPTSFDLSNAYINAHAKAMESGASAKEAHLAAKAAQEKLKQGAKLDEDMASVASAPFSGDPIGHPAVVGMKDPLHQEAGAELLQMMHLHPDKYASPQEASRFLATSGFIDAEEIPYFHAAAQKLQEHVDKGGSLELAGPAPEPPKPMPPPAPTLSSPMPSKPPVSSGAKPFEEAVYPINWNDLTSVLRRPTETATGPYAETLARAREQGYNVDLPLYHGTGAGLPYSPIPHENVFGPKAETLNQFENPLQAKRFEPGIFTSDAPNIAGLYSDYTSNVAQQIMPLFARPEKTLAVHWPDVAGYENYNSAPMHKLLQYAHGQGAEALVIHGVNDLGGPQTQYVFLKPNVLRSQFAAFNPAARESPVLTRSGGLPTFIPVDHDPFQEQQQ